MYINDPKANWNQVGREYLKQYSEGSMLTLTSDIRRIIEYLSQDHGRKQIEEINKEDLLKNIKQHVDKEENPLGSKNSVYKYIGRWNSFLNFIMVEKKWISTHVFLDELSDLKWFKEYVGSALSLSDESDKEPYPFEEILKVIVKIDRRLNGGSTDDQKYRYIQQSIFIQLVLLTGLPRIYFQNIKVSFFEKYFAKINGFNIKLPVYTSKLIEGYLGIRRSNDGHDMFFTSIRGSVLVTDSNISGLLTSNQLLVNLFKEMDIIDKDLRNISSTSLRNTAIIEMINTNEDLFTILKLTGLNKSNIKELDGYYEQIFNGKKSLRQNLNKDVNILIMRLPYYDFFNRGTI